MIWWVGRLRHSPPGPISAGRAAIISYCSRGPTPARASRCDRAPRRSRWRARPRGVTVAIAALLACAACASPETQLFEAVEQGDAAQVEVLLIREVDPNTESGEGLTPIFIAAQLGDPRIVDLLASAGADLSRTDAAGDTPLFVAIKNGMTDAAAVLLRHGIDPSATTADGNTALHLAVESGDEYLINQVLTTDVEVDAANAEGMTPLMLAADRGQTSVVESLLKAGASAARRDSTGRTALMLAARAGDERAITALLARGADREAKDDRGMTVADYARAGGQTILLSKIGNRPPAFTLPVRADQICVLGSFSISLEPALDPDGDQLNYDWRASRGRVLASGTSARVELDTESCTLESPIDVVITVNDGNGGMAQAVVQLR